MIGIDIVEVERIKNIYQRYGLSFLEKLLDQQEINELPAERNRCFFRKLSCYIASKEAIYKAWSDQDLSWRDIVIFKMAEAPLIYIKKFDVTQKIKLSCAISKEIVIAQALTIDPNKGHISVPLCHGTSQPRSRPIPALAMIEEMDA